MKNLKYIFPLLFIFISVGCSEDTIDALQSGSITGTVVGEGSFEPIENVRISTTPATSTVFTDENGEFVIENVAVDEYSVQARKEGFLTQFEGAEVLADSEISVIFEMQPENANNKKPNAPTLITPQDNAEGIQTVVDFTWNSQDAENDILTYELEIRNDRNNEVIRFTDLNDTVKKVEGLNYGYKYFWQVSVSDSLNEPVLSEVYSFNTLEFPKTRFIYVREMNNNNVIFARDLNGNEYQLTSENHNSFRPRKNHRTNKIAFLRTVGNQTHLFTMNLDGSVQTQITSNIPVNGFNLEKVDFSWANDGGSLVYPNFEKLYKVNVSGGGTSLIYEEPNDKFITEIDVSKDNSQIALLVNNANGYNAEIYTIDMSGNFMHSVISGLDGALGGLNLSVDNQRLLYTRDISGYESDDYRQLNSRMFIYNFNTNQSIDISDDKPEGTNDLDPRFSPNEAEVTYVNTSNDGISEMFIEQTLVEGGGTTSRQELYSNAKMPDWE
ncbi:Carboxypeptidase regulatory-like domain-containing protein [Salegentibacter holothuriorum]|uniref:Carboxypeptidase regulatory-like domain-containing protein n=1 Tax=Salegentibacter holothuriorum TaxID=241145 RepID=A0A1T5D205_9FLAO|nr:carboxypeptidase regulatory-like domain-containing protein [Salegentibacter holothuriorum]SKB65626.1 Carboxypeptidase regulatory-like domain-containing protein [Salegentibacter holothuriorum]